MSEIGAREEEEAWGIFFYRSFRRTHVFSFCFYNPRNRIADERPASYPIRTRTV